MTQLTLTYIELDHAQWKQHLTLVYMWSIGVANKKKIQFIVFQIFYTFCASPFVVGIF